MSVGDPPKWTPADLTMRVGGSISMAAASPIKWLCFECGIRINVQTGEVEIPDGLALDDASRAFWEGIGRLVR
jgi:hypothetical protein